MTRLLTERLLEAADRVPPLAAHDLRALLEVAADTINRLEEELVASRDEPAPDVAGLVAALEEIENPIKAMRDRLQDGEHLDGFAAVQLAGDAEYLRSIAREALAARRIQEDRP